MFVCISIHVYIYVYIYVYRYVCIWNMYIYYIILYYKNISIVYIYLQGAFTKCLDNYTYIHIYIVDTMTHFILYIHIFYCNIK